jgi:hypothetical protein
MDAQQKLKILPTQCINVRCISLTTNSDCVPKQYLDGWMSNGDSVSCEVRTESVNIIQM